MLCLSLRDSSTWLWCLLGVLGKVYLFFHLTLIPLASAEQLTFLVEEALLLNGMLCLDSLKMKTISGDWNWDLPPSVFSACSRVGSGVKELRKGWGFALYALLCTDSLACMHLCNTCVPIEKEFGICILCVSRFLAAPFLSRLFLFEEPMNLRSAASALSGSWAVQGGHTACFSSLGPVLEVFIQQADSSRGGVCSSGYVRLWKI